MYEQQMELYEKYPKKLVFVIEVGQTSRGEDFTETLNKEFNYSKKNINALYKNDLDFPRIVQRQSFFDKAEQSEGSNFRFGILSLSWIYKYQYLKPSIVVFVLNTFDNDFSKILELFIPLYTDYEHYFKHHKINTYFIIQGELIKQEEFKNQLQKLFKIPKKDILLTRTKELDEAVRETKNYILSHIDNFYVYNYQKNKKHFEKGKPEKARFQQYYLRNQLKMAFMQLFIYNWQKALKYFERSTQLCHKLKVTFENHYISNILKEKEFFIHFYSAQKVLELNFLANLSHVWSIFLRLKLKEINQTELYNQSINHLQLNESIEIWQHANINWISQIPKIHYFILFLKFFKFQLKNKENLLKMNCLMMAQNLLNCILISIKDSKKDLYNISHTINPQHYGMILEEQTINLSLETIQNKNKILIQEYELFFQNRYMYDKYNKFITMIILDLKNQNLERILNCVILQQIIFCEKVNLKINKEVQQSLETVCFQKFKILKNRSLQYIQNSNPEELQHQLKYQIEYNEFDEDLFQKIDQQKDNNKKHIQLSGAGFYIKKVFANKEIFNCEKINIDFQMVVRKLFVLKHLNSIKLIFNEQFYDKEYNTDQFKIQSFDENHSIVIIKQSLTQHNINLRSQKLILKDVEMILGSKISLNFDNNLPITLEKKQISFKNLPPFLIKTNLEDKVLFSRQFFPLEIEVIKNLKNNEDFDFKDFSVNFAFYEILKDRNNQQIQKDQTQRVKIFKKQSDSDELEQVSQEKEDSSQKQYIQLFDFIEDDNKLEQFYLKYDHGDTQQNLKLIIKVKGAFYYKDLNIVQGYEQKIEKKIISRLSFHVQASTNLIEQNQIQLTENQAKISKIEMGKEFFLNFYIISQSDDLIIKEIVFKKNTKVQIIDDINKLQKQCNLNKNNGMNYGLLMRVDDLVFNYNLGDLIIKWIFDGMKYESTTELKNNLIFSTFQQPFSINITCPLKTQYGQKFNLYLELKNLESRQYNYLLSLNQQQGKECTYQIAGLVNAKLTLNSQESKNVVFFVICYSPGIFDLPDITVQNLDTGRTNLVKTAKKVYVDY